MAMRFAAREVLVLATVSVSVGLTTGIDGALSQKERV